MRASSAGCLTSRSSSTTSAAGEELPPLAEQLAQARVPLDRERALLEAQPATAGEQLGKVRARRLDLFLSALLSALLDGRLARGQLPGERLHQIDRVDLALEQLGHLRRGLSFVAKVGKEQPRPALGGGDQREAVGAGETSYVAQVDRAR